MIGKFLLYAPGIIVLITVIGAGFFGFIVELIKADHPWLLGLGLIFGFWLIVSLFLIATQRD